MRLVDPKMFKWKYVLRIQNGNVIITFGLLIKHIWRRGGSGLSSLKQRQRTSNLNVTVAGLSRSNSIISLTIAVRYPSRSGIVLHWSLSLSATVSSLVF